MSTIVADPDWTSGFDRRGGGGAFEAGSLPDSSKEQLCRSLLAEFGVATISTREPDGELIHCCVMPWHPESKPSASLNYKKLTYRCLGCNARGGLLWFIEQARGISHDEAREWLGGATGLEGADFDLGALLNVIDALLDDAARSGPPPMTVFGESVLAPWRFIHPWLTTGVPELGIKGRDIPEANLMAMQVGYAEKYRIKIGEDDNDKPIFKESPRIIIPHYWDGDLVGWQSRRVSDDGTPKYQSTGDFPKDRTIYNYDRKRRKAVVVESPMSVLRHLHHLPIEGTFGASLTPQQIRLLAAHEVVVLWPDPDEAGWRSVEGYDTEATVQGKKRKEHVPGAGELLQPYCDVRVVDSPWSVDAAEIDDETAADLVANAEPFALWRRPTVITCWSCRVSHSGKCEGVN
jgi:hypothetical protein